MLNAGGALQSISIDHSRCKDAGFEGTVVTLKVFGSGRFGAFSNREPIGVKVGGASAEFHFAASDQLCTFDITVPEDEDLAVVAFTF
jgi:Raffinose synthase or seed imbibition protein Sip1